MSRRHNSRPSKKSNLVKLRIDGLEDRCTPADITIPAVVNPTPTNNNYTVLQNAINAAADGDRFFLEGVFDFTEPNAAAKWALGSDGIAGEVSGFTDDYSVYVPQDLTGVTVSSTFLGNATIKGPGDLPQVDLEAFLYFAGDAGASYAGWTISNLEIQDFDMAIGMFSDSPANAFDDVSVTNNRIRVAADLNGEQNAADPLQNVGIILGVGEGQTVSGNEIEMPGTGESGPSATDADLTNNPQKFASSVGIQTTSVGPEGYEGLLIDNNTITVTGVQSARAERVIGVWENGNAARSNIEVTNNQFLNAALGNDPAKNRQQAFWVASPSNAVAGTTVNFEGNTVAGAQLGFLFVSGQDFNAYPDTTAVLFTNNTLTNVLNGFLVQSNGQAALTGNVITGAGVGNEPGVGVRVLAGSRLDMTPAFAADRVTGFATGLNVAGEAVVTGAVITDNGVGILADGGTLLVEQTDLRNNFTAGIRVQDGAVVDAGQVTSADDFTGLGVSAGQNNFSAGYALGGAQAIVNANTGPDYDDVGPDGFPLDVAAQGNTFSGTTAADIEAVVRHDVDDPAFGFVDFSSAVNFDNLSVTAEFLTVPAFVGQSLTLLVRVTNVGTATANNVEVTTQLPVGPTFLDAKTSHGIAVPTLTAVTTAISALQPGETAVIRISVRPLTAAALSSTTTVTADETDATPLDNTATATTAVVNDQGGVVTVKFYGRRQLQLIGDAAANAVQVLRGATPDSFKLIGVGGTQLKFGTTTAVTLPDFTNITGGFAVNLAAGSDTFIVDGSAANEQMTVRGNVASNMLAGDDVFYVLHTNLSTGRLTGTGGVGNNRMVVRENTVKANVSFPSGSGNDTFTVRDNVITGNLIHSAGYGDDQAVIDRTQVSRTLLWYGGYGDDAISLTASKVTMAAGLYPSFGDDAVTVTRGTFGNSLTWRAGAGDDSFAVTDTAVAGNLAVGGESGTDQVDITRTTVAKNLGWSSSYGSDVLNFIGSKVSGNTSLTGSFDNDTVFLTNAAFNGTLVWNGGLGNDALTVSDTTVKKAFQAIGYSGNDTVVVRRSSFESTAAFDGGVGADNLDAGTTALVPGSTRGNVFAKKPTVKNFETVLS